MTKILYIKSGGHQSHEIFLKYLNYISFPVEFNRKSLKIKNLFRTTVNLLNYKKLLKKPTIMILEDPRIRKILDIVYPDIKFDEKIHISIIASPIVYYFLKKIRFSIFHKFSHILLMESLKDIDYFVCVSNMLKEVILKVQKNKKDSVFVIYPSPKKRNIEIFSSIKPDLSSNNIVFIGNIDYNLFRHSADPKGLNLLISAAEYLNLEKAPINIYIIGNVSLEIIKTYKKNKNIIFLGHKKPEEIAKYFQISSLYVHPAIFDSFSISTIEAMYAGLPTIVSKNTGVKEIVEKVRKDFVVDLDPKKIADKIIEYFNLSYSEKKELSELFREKAKEINPERSAKEFKEKIEEILKREY